MIRDTWRIVRLGLKSLMLHKLRSALTTAPRTSASLAEVRATYEPCGRSILLSRDQKSLCQTRHS